MQEVFEKIIEKMECEYENLKEMYKRTKDMSFYFTFQGVNKAIEIVKKESEKSYHGHFGCNTNGEHEKCDGCGLTNCKIGNKILFGVLDDNNGWILCEVKMPPVETEVFILAKRKFKNGDYKYIRTTAMYEDGTVLENDSCWGWEDIEGEWDEENDCYIIPEGWWENRHYNQDEVYNNAVDDEVIAWHPLPDPYNTSICKDTNCPYNDGNECPAAEGCAGYERKQTNADRIRSMSDEDLTKIIMCPYDTAGKPIEIMPCVNGNVQKLVPPEDCKKCMMEWLQQEVEG